MWQHWTNVILGAVVVFIAAFSNLGSALAWSFGIIGLVIAVLGFWGAAALLGSTERHVMP